ncbi:MAG: hypothetical protein IJ158_14050 [Treponema sp.]|nr:hypothetical protein [Treponema sp.]
MKVKACAKKLTLQILFLAFAVCMNYFGSVCAGKIILPLYLDSIITIAATAICGLWGGVLCAVLSNLAMYIFDRTMFVFVSCHILTAVFAWLTIRQHNRKCRQHRAGHLPCHRKHSFRALLRRNRYKPCGQND